ncbi:adenosylcobinamide-GDP ribazoletransferase [Salinirubellus sp. GCM10025818]|uniref:adenosylcobinamide-GDP ribazoletransferase n=1 Tax=Salinirubellus TaxID=2162630 RepID=UPI0030D30272
MVLSALRGALGFLTRLPVGHDEASWDAFRRTPVAFPLAGYFVGTLLAIPVVLPVPEPVVAFLFVCWMLAVTGITHLDGLADLGDAAVVHDPERRRAAMKDSQVGVGGTAAVVLSLVGLALAGLGLAELPLRTAVGLVVAAEVSAKLSMAGLAAVGTAAHEGLGSQVIEGPPRRVLAPAIVSLPVLVLTWPSPAAAVGLLVGLLAAWLLARWVQGWLGGLGGDALGAANELARLAALHAGIVVWYAL